MTINKQTLRRNRRAARRRAECRARRDAVGYTGIIGTFAGDANAIRRARYHFGI